MLLTNLLGPSPVLAVMQPSLDVSADVDRVEEDGPVELALQNLAKKLILGFALPPAVHVGFAQTKGTHCQDALKEPWILYLDVTGTIAADDNIGIVQ